MRKLENRIAIITGAASGMGKATAKKMAEYGAKVNIIDFSPEVMTYALELRNEGYEATGYQADVRDGEKLKEIYKEVFEKYGKIDAVVNAAGVAVFSDFTDDKTDTEAHREIDINYFGVWNSCRAAAPYMKEAKYGKIVNFSSVTGVMVCDPGSSAYAATKGAVMAFTKALASELASSNITVNAILPGVIDTPMIRKVYEGVEGGVDAALTKAAKAIPMGRLGNPEEVAEVACFLTSNESSYVTGHGLVIDGGSTLPESFV
ncbi:MAG: glucose 1-dehydrogenase [Bacilli bacterium]|nr:glucose 1-dehydrogenase [Bacilli bacterium]